MDQIPISVNSESAIAGVKNLPVLCDGEEAVANNGHVGGHACWGESPLSHSGDNCPESHAHSNLNWVFAALTATDRDGGGLKGLVESVKEVQRLALEAGSVQVRQVVCGDLKHQVVRTECRQSRVNDAHQSSPPSQSF
jgi:hypothetical protein